jgi:hypothetical protein
MEGSSVFGQSEAGSSFCTHLVKGMFQKCLVQAPPEFNAFSMMRGWMVFLLVVQQAASKLVAVKL